MYHNKLCFLILMVMFLGLGSVHLTQPVLASTDDQGESAPTLIRFNFKGATFTQVIDFFSRTTGLPVVWETTAPEGTLDFQAVEAYNLPEALRVLNIILQAKGVMLRVSDDMLYLQKLSEMGKENVPTFIGELPEELTDDQIITVVRPLTAALAKPLAEKLATMVAAYGSVTALEQQNAIMIVETAAQARRLLKIIDELDRNDPEGAVEIFRIVNARAEDLMVPLKALLTIKVKKFVINQQGKQTEIEENSMPGLNISVDVRTNSIIAKGAQHRLDKLKETIALLDVPATDGGRSMRTFMLATLSAVDASGKLEQLFAKLPEADRPTVLALGEENKVTVVGRDATIVEAAALLKEIDGLTSEPGAPERRMTVVSLEYADPGVVLGTIKGLLTRRQTEATRLAAGPDGRSLVVAGIAGDVDQVKQLIQALDSPPRMDKQVRLLRLEVPDAPQTIKQAYGLYDKQVEGTDPAMKLTADYDEKSRLLTLAGSRKGVDLFSECLRMAESHAVITRETRQVKLSHARPRTISSVLTVLVGQLLRPHDGTKFVAPVIEPVEALDLLVITAMPEQFGVIESLVETLDRARAEDYQFRVMGVKTTDAEALQDRTRKVFARMTQGLEEEDQALPEVEFDALTGNLLVSGRTESVKRYERALTEARRLMPPDRAGRLIALRQAKAEEVLEPLRELLFKTAVPDGARFVPEPTLEAIAQTNSLYVVAEPAQHAAIEKLVRQLDTFELAELPPLRILQVRTADANQLAAMLRRRYDSRPAEQRREKPVEISSDAGTNTLIVTAHRDVYDDIKEFVDGVNRSGESSAEKETMIFPLKRARAMDVAAAMDKLYPQPPMPRDRRGRPMPHLQKPKEVHVSADAATNTLIVEAPVERRASFEALVEQLDRVEMPPTAQLRTYYIDRGDPVQIARTLNDLARKGVLNAPPEDRSKPVEVLIQAEPVSRTLIVAGDEVTFAKVEEVLEDLKAVPVKRELRVIEVTGADPQEMADRALALYEEQTAEIRDAGTVSVEVDRNASVLLVVADAEAMIRFSSILNQLQATVGPQPDVRLVAIEYAEAMDIVSILEDLTRQHMDTMGHPGMAPPIFQVIERTNSILIAAQPELHTIVRTLIQNLDRPEEQDMPPLRILQLRTADAPNLANALMRQYSQRSTEERRDKPVHISADVQTNTLMIAAHPDMLEEITGIVDDLNKSNRQDYEGREIRIFPLVVARAEELAKTIDEMYPEPPMPRDRRGRPMPHLQQPREVVVRADPQTNSLIVDAPVQRMAGFEKLVEQLDRQQVLDETEVRAYHLVHADLAAVTNTLRQLAASGSLTVSGRDRRVGITISSEPVSRTVVVSGPQEIFSRVEEVLERLDGKREGLESTLRFISLRHARAETLAVVVRSLLENRVREYIPDLGDKVEQAVNVSADGRTNTLIISAPQQVMGMAEQTIRELDLDPAAGTSRRSVRVLAIRNADASELAENLEAVFGGEEATELPPTIRVDRASNTLLIRGSDEQFEMIRQVVSRIDEATIASTRQMQVIPIDPSRAKAADIARTLQRILDRNRAGTVEVITIEELIKRKRGETDAEESDPAKGASSMLPMSLPHQVVLLAVATPQDGGSFNSLFKKKKPVAKDAEGSDITIAVDPETNNLIVVGSPRMVERAMELARQLQDEIPAAPGKIRYIPLPTGMDALNISRLVNQVLSQMTPPGGRRGDLRRRVGVLTDRPANAIVVTASDHDFRMVGELIAAMSQPAASEEFVVKVYPLQSITSDRALNRIQILLGTGSQPRRGRQPSGFGNIAMRLWGDAFSLKAEIDPQRIRISSDTQSNSLMVMAPAESIPFLDRFISMLDKAPVNVQSTLKMYALHHAKATDLRRTLRQVFLARFRSRQRQAGRSGVIPVQPEFAADDRTNTLLVTASPEQLLEIDTLLTDLDDELGNDRQPLHVIELKAALPGQAASLLNKVVIGSDQQRRAETLIVPDDQSGVLMVRASEAVMAEIRTVLTEIDREAAREYEIRTITLERADAGAVAQAIQRFYDDRARIASSGRGRRAQTRRVSIIGDPTSNTLMIAASEEKFAEIQTLVKQFDTPQANQSWSFRVYPLENAKATEIQRTVQNLLRDLTWGNGPIFFFGGRNSGQNSRNRGQIAVRADARLNALIVTGGGDKFDLIEELIKVLDAAPSEGEQRMVRLYRVEHANLSMVAEVVREVFSNTTRQWWEPVDPREIKVRIDETSRTLIVSGTTKEHEELATLVQEIDTQTTPPEQQIEVLALKFAQARELARTLTQFVNSRARMTNQPRGAVTISASDSANALIVSADPENLAMLKDMLAQLDQPDATGERVIEIIALKDGDAAEIARILTQQFGRRAGRGQARVVVTPDARTNSLIINAPRQEFAQAKLLIEQLDGQAAADETIIRTYALTGAQADEAQRILRETLQLDARGETKGIIIKLDDDPDAVPVEVKAKIVSDPRSNSLIVTATAESFPVIESLIERLDTVPAVNPVEYRIIPLQHAMAIDVRITLEEMTQTMPRDQRPQIDYNRLENQLIIAATADQFEQLQKIIAELDQPPTKERTTDFVPLQFAEAEQIREALSVFYGSFAPEADTPGKLNVRIVADPASNSLVITAAEEEWAGIRELLAKLDSEEYDSSLQLRVMPLRYADAGSVAKAINEAFAGTIERRNRGGKKQSRNGGNREVGESRRDMQAPSILVESEEWVRASAEEITNAVIVSASRKNMGKIERIINELDVADYATMPPPRLIPVKTGDPVKFAETLRGLYEQQRKGADRGSRGGRALRIVGDKHSNTIIVRADDDEFAQISALAEALEQEASSQGLAVHVLVVERVPAARVAAAIREAFAKRAEQAGQPLSIQVDSRGNTLVIASTGGLFEEIKEVVAELDALSPSRGQGIFIIELENISPAKAKQIIQTIGLDRPQREDSTSKLVTEPIAVSVLSGRNAILVVANPADKDTIIGLMKALDAAPEMAEARVRVVRLNHAEAGALAGLLTRMFNPSDQQSGVDLARQVAEQVRRLAVRRDGLDEPDLSLDLTIPIRIIPDAIMNALIISSSPENVEAVEELVKLLDELPITEAVTVQFFPLENIAADEFARIVKDLFRQGKGLGRVPGTNLRGVPGGITGKALLDEIALTVDDRTNTVIVAGKEDSVALVEVLVRRVDADVVMGWVEPKILPLRYADATDLAELLHAIVVEGTDNLPQSSPLQRQTARLRMARIKENGGQVLESEVFFPMTRLMILPESQLNALILMGTPANLEIITELVGMLDIEQASPSATVRIYPVEHASAARLASILESLFQEQVNSKAIRPEDRVIVKSDDRSNALIVTTSPRSFAVLEGLLKTLDAEIAPDLRAIRRIPVIHASANRLARLIQELMDARLDRLRKVQPETADLERATIIADPRTNSLVIAAGNESYEVIKRLAEDLDESKLTDTSLVQVIVLEHGNPDRIAEAVRAIMERRYADLPAELRKSQSPLILTDPRTNSLLVAANPEDYSAIEDLVNKLERTELNPAVGLHVLALDPTSSAEPMATKLQRLMRDREQTLGDARTPSDRVTIEPDAASNSLIVAANEENLQVVRELIRVLAAAETEAATGREVELLTLATSRAADIVDMLNDLYVDEANRTRGTGVVRVTADERLNAVLIKAPERDIKALRRLVAQLDGAKPATVVEIKYIPLNSANAFETVGLIEDVLSGRGIGPRRGRRGQQATILRYLREISGEDELGDDETGGVEIEVSAAIREAITLTPDLRTNTVIVSAPRESIGMIEKMIRDLDSSSIGAKNIRIYKLKNADAVAMAEILTDLFNLRQGNTLNVLKPRETPGRPIPGIDAGTGGAGYDASGAGGGGLSGVELTTIPDERQRLSITVDSRTNSLIVSGSPTYLDLVSQVVDELDALDANEREVFVYQLRNAVAGEVADVIGSFVQQEQQKLISTLSPDQIGSAARILEREITIQGDDNSNTVLVSASPRYMDTVKRMIDELDVDPPQVLIQVMLAEVTIDNMDEWGVDFKSRVRTGSTNILGDFGLASAFVGGLGVPSMTIASTDFQMIIRAMASTGRLQVLSNPSVMAANNSPARIQVGETIRIPASTSVSDAGQTNSTVEAEDIGVILEVTPSINPDGFVRMDIHPEISSLSQRTTQISENFQSPIITKRTVDTTVTVYDGQTIVIGGLISDRFETRFNKVPFLGDLPLIGGLFRSEVTERAKTELLIVLTPYVITSPAELHQVGSVTDALIDQLSVPDEVKASIRHTIESSGGGLFDAEGNRLDGPPRVEPPAAPPENPLPPIDPANRDAAKPKEGVRFNPRYDDEVIFDPPAKPSEKPKL